MTDQQIRDYHIGMSFDQAWRAYAGMIELGESSLERIVSLVPEKIGDQLLSYFKAKQAE